MSDLNTSSQQPTKTINVDLMAVEAILNTGYSSYSGDIRVRIIRRAHGSGTSIVGYTVSRTSAVGKADAVESELASVARTDWFSRLPQSVSAAILSAENSVPGYMGSAFGSLDNQTDAKRHEVAKSHLRAAVDAWQADCRP